MVAGTVIEALPLVPIALVIAGWAYLGAPDAKRLRRINHAWSSVAGHRGLEFVRFGRKLKGGLYGKVRGLELRVHVDADAQRFREKTVATVKFERPAPLELRLAGVNAEKGEHPTALETVLRDIAQKNPGAFVEKTCFGIRVDQTVDDPAQLGALLDAVDELARALAEIRERIAAGQASSSS